jgi:hypothetical protein
VQNFEGQTEKQTGIFPNDWSAPQGWRQMGSDSAFYWKLDTMFGAYGQSNTCMHFDNASHNNTGKKYSICTPEFDFSNVSSAVLTYDYAYAPMTLYSVLKTDTLAVKYSTDCGATWTTLFAKGGVALNTSGTSTWGTKENGEFFFPVSNQWKTETINLNALAGKSNVMLSFEDRSGYGAWLFVDNISLTSATGIAEEHNENSISVYPNPSSGNFVVSGLNSSAEISVYDLDGRKVFETFSAEPKVSVSLASKTSGGMYFVKIKTEAGEVGKKIVIQK